jgi:hypothetical protein
LTRRNQPLEQIDLLISIQQLLLALMDVGHYLGLVRSLSVNLISKDVDAASLQLLASNNTSREEDLEDGVFGLL